ncbi:MAG: glycosyltransferase family 39 protein [Chromatiales bacterium]|jgi:4-amino-4-deoxy-L-arabinose transferase-like glycosyltransferase|nr:glycosyltransferase family 39 protein [Chromatiales bacterium]MDX9766672.1 glycosyltransferase family 39 protein [Ectothiorhodospiraceae bacterium]
MSSHRFATDPDVVRFLPWLIAALYAGFFFNLGGFPLFDLDEGAFGSATMEMLARRDFVSTWLYGEPRYDKPILIYWLQAASVTLLGLNEIGLRLPSAIAATLWMLLIAAFGRRVLDARTGIVAAILAATSIEVAILGRAAIADALLNLCIAGAMFALFLYYRERRVRWLYAAAAAIGFGMLTKGPVALLIPLAVSFLFHAIKGEWRLWLRTALHPGAIALVIAIVLPWYVAQYLREGPAFIEGFIFRHNLGRFSAPMEGHGGGPWFYLPVALLGVLPYTALLIGTLAAVRQWFRDDLQLWLLLWFAFVFVFFSLAATKLPHYLLYGMTPLFLLMAIHRDRVANRFWLFLPPLLLFLLLLFLPQLVDLALPYLRDEFVQAQLADHHAVFGHGYQVYFALAAMLCMACMFWRRLPRLLSLFAAGLLTAVGVAGHLAPSFGAIQQVPVRDAAYVVRALDEPAVMWRLNMPTFNIYSGRIVEKREPQVGEIAVTKVTSRRRLGEHEVLYESRGILLVRITGPLRER